MPTVPEPQISAPSRGGRRFPGGAALVTGLLLAVVTLFLLRPDSAPGAALARASYDLTFRLRPAPDLSAPGASPVLMVLLDRRTFEGLSGDPSEPLDRMLHAQLVHRLRRAGAVLVAFDILFDQPAKSPQSDEAFAAALREHGNVLLSAEWHRSEFMPTGTPGAVIRSVSLPRSNLLAAAAGHGFAFSRVDPDFVVRRHFPGFTDRDLPSLTWQAAVRMGSPVTLPGAAAAADERWMNYYGPPLTIPNVSYIDALDESVTPAEVFRGKVVIVGTRPTAGRFDERRDEWRNPVTSWGRGLPFMPAVEVHATELLNLLRGDWLRRPARRVEALGLVVVALVLALVMVPMRPAAAAATAAGAVGVTAVCAGWLAGDAHRWFPWLIVALVQVPGAATASFLVHTVSWYQQRRRFRARIREQAALLDKAQDAILVLDLDRRITYANPRARQLYGWTDPLPGSRPAAGDLDPDRDEAFRQAWLGVLSAGEWTGELQQANAAGEPIIVASRATLIRDDRGRPRQVLFINTDITERKRLQDQFLRAQRRETIGALAGGMAHDLNNALSPILMGIQRLKARNPDEATLRMLDIMETNTLRGAGMVRQVLLFSRGEDAALVSVNLAALLRELEAVLRASFPESIELSVLAPEDLWPVRANATQIHQILLNLCLNARDAMPQGGRLTLAADNAELTAEERGDLPGLTPGPQVMLLVSDTGTGMPPEVQRRLFEPFFTTKPPGSGTGLGLATVSSLVKAHSGALRVRSQPGEGTTFELYFPAAPAQPTPSTTGAPPPRRGQGETLLLVDDELSLRELLREGLVAHGYEVRVASSGVEALALVRDPNLQPRLVITDWRLTALPGRNLASVLREEFPTLPLLIVSGALPEGRPAPDLAGGPVVVLAKPFRLEDLLERVATVLHSAPPAG